MRIAKIHQLFMMTKTAINYKLSKSLSSLRKPLG
jgi:hypothetical protein